MTGKFRSQSTVVVSTNVLVRIDEVLDDCFHSVEVIEMRMRLEYEFQCSNLVFLDELEKPVADPILFRQVTIDQSPPIIGESDENGIAMSAVE
jgi:hypothetical protein